MAIKFTKSPTGEFKLGYNVGDEVSLPAALEKELLEKGFAIPVEDPKKSTAK
jgi:hypothetical protein